MIAKLRADGGVGGGDPDYKDPRPLDPAKLAALTLRAGKPRSPSLRAWLAYASNCSLPVLSRSKLRGRG